MLYLRIALFLGLVLHKLVWEMMKVNPSTTKGSLKSFTLSIKTVVKLIKIIALLFLVVQTLFLDVFPVSQEPGNLRLIGTGLYIFGLLIAILGRVQLGRNWANLEDYQVIPEQRLVRSGIYRYIRHPIYTGDFLLILGLELVLNSWLVLGVVALALFLFKQTRDEEVVLARAFPDYAEYQRQSKRFIPFVI